MLAASIIITSCSRSSGGGDGNDFIPQIRTTTPIFLKKDYPTCPTIYAQSSNTQLEIIKFFNGTTETQRVDFNALLTGNKLVDRKKAIFLETLGDYKNEQIWIRKWNDETNEYEFADFKKDEANGEQFEICKGAGSFSKDSLENAALNITNTISKTRASILAALPDMKIPPVIVRVIPKESYQEMYLNGPKAKNGDTENENGDKVFKDQKEYRTDNATWYNDGFNNYITFFPQSEEFKRKTGLVTPFWEMPMVGAHEFGHHIFDKIFPRESSTDHTFKRKRITNCMNSEMHHDLATQYFEQKIQDDEERVSGGMFAYRSLHEGIGDLIAFYGLEKDGSSLKNVKCMEKSRDSDSKYFGDGTLKKIDQNVVRIMNSKEYLLPTSKNCAAPFFQDSHAIGAIFAHNFENIVSNYTNSRVTKLKILLLWGKEASKYQTKLNEMTSSRYIAEVTKVLFKTIYKEIGSANLLRDCNLIKDLFYELNADFGSTEHMNCK